MRNTADVTGGKLSPSDRNPFGVSAGNPSVAFYDNHGRKRERLYTFFNKIVCTRPNPQRRVDVRQAIIKIISESLSQHDEKHVVPSPFSGIRDKKENKIKKEFVHVTNNRLTIISAKLK
jgi:hypothetical protein